MVKNQFFRAELASKAGFQSRSGSGTEAHTPHVAVMKTLSPEQETGFFSKICEMIL